MSLFEIQENITMVDKDVTGLAQSIVDFLFDEQVIQDEKLLDLEETSDQVVRELAEINAK